MDFTDAIALTLPRAMVDFETYSILSVKDVGAWAYSEHPSTEILCMGYQLPGMVEPLLWTPELPFPQAMIDHVAAGYVIEAHHTQFEKAIWTNVLPRTHEVPPIKWMICTLSACAYRSLPLGLDKVGAVLGLDIVKDSRGKLLLNRISKPRKPTKNNPDTRTQDWELYEDIYDYCLQDIRAEKKLGDTLGDLPPGEFKVWQLDQTINERGVKVDVDAVYAAMGMIEEITETITKELVALTDGRVTTASQVARITEWVASKGVYLPNLQADTLEILLAEGNPELKGAPNVRRVLEIRQLLGLASIKKVFKFAECLLANGTIRGLLQYHGAGTGRWAGRLVQPQNFPRGTIKEMEDLILAIKTGNKELLELFFGEAMAAISSALRGMFVADDGCEFFVADFAAIEARVVMWLAEEDKAIEAFYQFDKGVGPDIYCLMAENIYGYPVNKKDNPAERQLGKIGILGCGYQMGPSKLKIQAEQSYKVFIEDDMAVKIVDTYREKYPNVPKLWWGLEDAAVKAVQNKSGRRHNRISFEYVVDKAGPWLAMVLPSGRRIWYFRPEIHENVINYIDRETGETKQFVKDALTYEGRDNKKGGGWARIPTYGGMITENAVQAIARDLMVSAMFRVERRGYPIVMTVHDEIVSQRTKGTGSLKDFVDIVTGPNPKWAKGCPVAAEGWQGPRYKKG